MGGAGPNSAAAAGVLGTAAPREESRCSADPAEIDRGDGEAARDTAGRLLDTTVEVVRTAGTTVSASGRA